MLALTNVFQSGSDKNTKILKPWWNVLNDYMVVLMMAVPIFVGGMELALSKLTCLPVVYCSFSKHGMLLSGSIYRETCSAFYSSRCSTDANGKTTTVITGLKNRPEYDYVNSECKTSVQWFYSYFSLFLFGQAFSLLVLNNLWLKFPSTASFVDTFYALVAECYNLAIPGAYFVENNKKELTKAEEQERLLLALSGILSDNQQSVSVTHEATQAEEQEKFLPAPSDNQQSVYVTIPPKQAEDQGSRLSASSNSQQSVSNTHEATQAEEQERLFPASSGILSDNQHELSIGVDLQTAVLAKALFEKISRFNRYIQTSRLIQILYLAQAVLQAALTGLFIGIDLWRWGDLKETVNCSIDEYVPVVYHNFTCYLNLAWVFQTALVLFLILLGLSCVFCIISVKWTIGKVNFGKRDRKYRFDDELNSWKMPSDLPEAKEDMGFLLHLLHACNELYAVQFGICMSKKQYKRFKALILDSEWPMEKLEKCVTQNKDGVGALYLRDMGGIPHALLQLSFTFNKGLRFLELNRCGPLEADDFREFYTFYELERLAVINCGLTGEIPEGLFMLKELRFLVLKNNSIMHIQDGISKLKKLETLEISSNKLKTIDASIANLPLVHISISNNPKIQIPAIKNILACKNLKELFTDNYDYILSELNQKEREKFQRVTKKYAHEDVKTKNTTTKMVKIENRTTKTVKTQNTPTKTVMTKN